MLSLPWGHPAVVGIGLIAMFCVAMAGHRAQQSLEQQEHAGQAPIRSLSPYGHSHAIDRRPSSSVHEATMWTEDNGERFPDSVRIDASTWFWMIVGALFTVLFALAMGWQIVSGLLR